MKALLRPAILILILYGTPALGQDSVQAETSARQILHEMRYDLINRTAKNSVRVVASPLKFKWKDWAYTGLVAGAVGVAFTQDEYFYRQLRGREASEVRWLADNVGEPFGNAFVATGVTLGTYMVAKSLNYEAVSDPALVAFQSVIITGGATTVLKFLLHRQRPREGLPADPGVFYGPSFRTGNFSFPSAHTGIAFALATSMSTYYNEQKWLPFVLYPLATLTAWSRIHDNEHWFSDVVGGAAIGYFIGRTVAKPELYRWSVSPNSRGGMSIGFNYSF